MVQPCLVMAGKFVELMKASLIWEGMTSRGCARRAFQTGRPGRWLLPLAPASLARRSRSCLLVCRLADPHSHKYCRLFLDSLLSSSSSHRNPTEPTHLQCFLRRFRLSAALTQYGVAPSISPAKKSRPGTVEQTTPHLNQPTINSQHTTASPWSTKTTNAATTVCSLPLVAAHQPLTDAR